MTINAFGIDDLFGDGGIGLAPGGADGPRVGKSLRDTLRQLVQAAVQKYTIDVPLTKLQAQTSGTAFAVGSSLPAGASLLRTELVVVAPLAGGSVSAATAQIQGGADAAGTILGGSSGVDVFSPSAGSVEATPVGSNPYVSRGGQQLTAKITATGDTMAHLTAGHLQIDAYITVPTGVAYDGTGKVLV